MKVKITDPRLPIYVMQRIMQHPDFSEVANLVRRNASGRIYLVGGKVYRTIIELVHGYDCGAKDVDWDFLCMGTVAKRHRAYLHTDWSVDRQDGSYKANSMCLSYWDSNKQTAASGLLRSTFHSLSGPIVYSQPVRKPDKKIDIIGIKDIPTKHGTIQDYFDSVPLDIQTVGLSTEDAYPTLYGQALKSIETKTISINNESGTLRPFDVNAYASAKALSLKFNYDYKGSYRSPKVPCNCFENDIKALFRMGCQRKDIHL